MVLEINGLNIAHNGYNMNGTLDEVYIINRSWIFEDVQNSYLNGTGLFYAILDATPPSFSVLPYNSTTGNDTATISWTTSETANYTLRYTTSSAYTGGTLISNATTGTARTHNLLSLTNYTQYYINVSTWDTSGNYNQSNTSFMTAQNAAGAAYDPCVCPSPITNWYFACNSCPELPACDLKGYDLYLQGTGTTEQKGDIMNVKNIYMQDTCDLVLSADYDIYPMMN